MAADPDDGAAGGAAAVPERRPEAGRRWVRWTRTMENDFFDTLVATGSISAAARAVGIAPQQAHYRHRVNARFAERWSEAVAAGRRMIEMRIVGHVLGGETDRIVLEDALRVLSYFEARAAGTVKRGGVKPMVATREQTDATILSRLAALAARKAKEGGA